MAIIRRIGVVSFAKLQAFIMCLMGFILGIIIAVASQFAGEEVTGSFFATGIAAIIVMPLVYGILGFIAGLITGWLYNLGARFVGGIEIDLEKK